MDDLSLLDRIYEAGAMPELWPDCLEFLAVKHDAKLGMLSALARDGVKLTGSSMIQEILPDWIAGNWAARDPRIGRLMADQSHPGFRTALDYWTEAELEAMPLYREFLGPRGISASVATIIQGVDDMPLILTFEGFADHRIAQGLLARFDRLRPHLARAAVFSAQLGLERVRAAMAALQMVGVAAAMLDGQGRLQGANPSFEQLLGRGLWDGRDRFMLGDANGDAYFREALAKVLQGGSGRSMAVQIHDDDRSAVLHLIPIRGSARDVFVGSSMIMVLSEGGDARGQVDPTLLRSLFDLTAAEARVARMMLQGRTVGEIAGLCGIGHETVRSQLKAAMHKTGARRQSEFVLLLKGLALPQT